jgi:hypothetical protein
VLPEIEAVAILELDDPEVLVAACVAGPWSR